MLTIERAPKIGMSAMVPLSEKRKLTKQEVVKLIESLDQELVRLARRIGLDMEDPWVLEQLDRGHFNSYECARLLGIGRVGISKAVASGTLHVDLRLPRGEQENWYIKPLDLLQWAANRPERYRYKSAGLAWMYAREDGVPVSELLEQRAEEELGDLARFVEEKQEESP